MVDQKVRGGQTTKGNAEPRIGVPSNMASTPELPPGTSHPPDPGGRSGDGSGAVRVEIPEEDQALLSLCRVDTFRAGGPGGQHQNVTESAVRLTHLPTGTVVVARDERSQHRNRSLALARLRKALEALNRVEPARVPTRVPRIQKLKRREAKSRRSQVKRTRRPPRTEE